MGSMIQLNFDKPEEVRPNEPSSGKVELVNLAGGPVGDEACVIVDWQGVSGYARRS